jgi:hypothetical protein
MTYLSFSCGLQSRGSIPGRSKWPDPDWLWGPLILLDSCYRWPFTKGRNNRKVNLNTCLHLDRSLLWRKSGVWDWPIVSIWRSRSEFQKVRYTSCSWHCSDPTSRHRSPLPAIIIMLLSPYYGVGGRELETRCMNFLIWNVDSDTHPYRTSGGQNGVETMGNYTQIRRQDKSLLRMSITTRGVWRRSHVNSGPWYCI